MVPRFSFATFILCFIAAVIVKATAFQRCGYTNTAKSKNCNGQGFTDIPYQYLNEPFESLDLSYNNLTYLNTTGFDSLSYRDLITTIYLNNNKISKIPHRVFYEVPNLKELHLSNNLEMEIGTQFCHMQNLETLVLENTMVTFTSNNSLTCLKKLKRLLMRNSSLSKLPVNIFKNTNLEELDLSQNYIENMDEIELPKQTLEMDRYNPPENVHDSSSRTDSSSTIDSSTTTDSSNTNSSSSNIANTNTNTTSTAVSSSNPTTAVSSSEHDNYSQNTSEEKKYPKATSNQGAITLWVTTVIAIVAIIAITFGSIFVYKFCKRYKDKNADVQSYDDSESTVSFIKSTESRTISIS